MNPGEWLPPPVPPAGEASQPARGRRGLLVGGGLLAAGVVAGAIVGGTVLSSAATTSPSAPSSTSTAAPGTGSGQAPNKQSTPVRGDEKAVTADQAAKLKAAALKAVPGGTVYRVETDADGDAYEAHMTKADGSMATVKFDKNLAVVRVEEGMGAGGPGGHGHGGPGGAGSDNDSDDSGG